MDTLGARRYITPNQFLAEQKRTGGPLKSRTTLYEALRQGDLPHIRRGRLIFIPTDALDIMLATQANGRWVLPEPGSEQSAA